MKRSGQVLIELLLGAIFLIFFIPIVQNWSSDAGGKTLLHQVERDAIRHNEEILTGGNR